MAGSAIQGASSRSALAEWARGRNELETLRPQLDTAFREIQSAQRVKAETTTALQWGGAARLRGETPDRSLRELRKADAEATAKLDATQKAYDELQEQVERGAEAAGRDAGTLRRVVNCAAYVGSEDPATVMPSARGTPGGLTGTLDQVLEIIERHREAGVDTFHVNFPDGQAHEQIPAFGEQVIAKLRG